MTTRVTDSHPPTKRSLEDPTGIARFLRLRWLAASAAIWAVFAVLSYLSAVYQYLPFDVSIDRWVQSVNWGPLNLSFPFITSLSGTPGNVATIAVLALVGLANWRALPFAIDPER